MKAKLIITGLTFLAFTTLSYGQNNETTPQPQNSNRQGIACFDANNNGICDNYENRSSGTFRGRRTGNFNDYAQGQRRGQGQRGWCHGQGQGRGRNFVDANKNGICDNNEISPKK
jgi:hypothetical protein